MERGLLINDLELGYAPMSAFAFKQLISENDFAQNVADSHLYIIVQRRELTFNNFSSSDDKTVIKFEIRQDKNDEHVQCILPIFQKHIATDWTKGVDVRLHNRRNTIDKKIPPPYNGTQSLTFQEVDPQTNKKRRLIWFSPDKLLQNYWKGYIKAEINGNFRKMLEYNVHYVGKSTEQNICQRLSNHSTFQDILVSQDALSFGNIPSNEIMVLLLRIKDNHTISKWGQDSSEEQIINYLQNYQLPNDMTVSLDAEKALIKHLQPKYNKIIYKSYPNSNDLINQERHDVVLYGIVDPITLIYENGKITGGPFQNRDYISVEKKTTNIHHKKSEN
jgi:hypothetical protein